MEGSLLKNILMKKNYKKILKTLMKMPKKIKIGIIGLGYVGLPLFINFQKNLKQKVLILIKIKFLTLKN